MEELKKKIILEIKNFLKTCDIYFTDEAKVNEESETFKISVDYLKEKLSKIEKLL